MTEQVTVLFPMAGRGERFGGTFKPFLTFRDQTFIEAALAPFRPYTPQIREFVFAYLDEQEQAHGVRRRLEGMFVGLPFRTVTFETPTRGPAETISRAVHALHLKGPVVICDCDHAVQVGPLFERVAQGAPWGALVPLWSLEGEDVKSWAVAGLSADGRVGAIAEKARPAGFATVAGVIGCYVFSDIEQALALGDATSATNFSEILAQMIAKKDLVDGVFLKEADFFGDPARLNKALSERNG